VVKVSLAIRVRHGSPSGCSDATDIITSIPLKCRRPSIECGPSPLDYRPNDLALPCSGGTGKRWHGCNLQSPGQ